MNSAPNGTLGYSQFVRDLHERTSRILLEDRDNTLIKIVDENGGYTVIPELHLPLLHDGQQKHVRQLAAPTPVREISLVIRQDYVRERLINAVADAVKAIIPDEMLDARLKKFAIKL